MRKVLGGMLLAGLFLLMLNALVVTPQDIEPPMAPPENSMHREAAFAPRIFTDRVETEAGDRLHGLRTRQESNLQPVTSCLLCDGGTRDANGRVLRSGRYENSVYQLFRAEVAGG